MTRPRRDGQAVEVGFGRTCDEVRPWVQLRSLQLQPGCADMHDLFTQPRQGPVA
jgi:hypothetical protein